jgi:hypothetical protein
MTKIKMKELIWDDWNLEHIKKHCLSVEEVVQASKIIIYHRSTYQKRYLVICRGEAKLITLIIKRKGQGKYYLVTARNSSRKEKRRINEKNKK